MKKLSLFLVPSLALGLAACQSDDALNSASNDSAQNATITVSIPDAMTTRAADELTTATDALFGPTSNSAMGGLTNLMNPKETATNVYNKYDLRYKLAVYEATKIVEKDTTWTLVIPANADNNTLRTLGTWTGGADANKQTFSLQLLPTHTYKVVCWADFVKKGETGDLHYATDCLSNANATSKVITCKDAATAQLNDESRDAYYIQQTFKEEDVTAGLNANLVLRRPFAKIRFVTTDWQSMDNAKDEWPDTYKLTYHGCKRFKDFNPVTAESTSEDLGDATTVYTGNKISLTDREYALNYDMHKKNRTLVVDYLMTEKPTENSTGETAIHMNFEAINSTSGKTIMTRDFTTDIPIKRNWLTTILGNLLTVNGKFTVSINENFKNEWVVAEPWWNPAVITMKEPKHTYDSDGYKVYHITTPGELVWLSENSNTYANSNKENLWTYEKSKIVLDADIDMGNVDNWQPIHGGTLIGANSKGSINGDRHVFDGQGHVLRNFKINAPDKIWGNGTYYAGVFGFYYGDIKNVTFENITINGLSGSTTNSEAVSQLKQAGCIGQLTGKLINVHAKHVFIRCGSGKTSGGLVGKLAPPTDYSGNDIFVPSKWASANIMWEIKDCTAEDIHLQGECAGGLIGDTSNGYVFDNCKTDYIYIINPYEAGRFVGRVPFTYNWFKTNNTTTDNVWFTDESGNAVDYTEEAGADKKYVWGSAGYNGSTVHPYYGDNPTTEGQDD